MVITIKKKKNAKKDIGKEMHIGNEFALELTKLSVFKTEPPSVNPAPIIW